VPFRLLIHRNGYETAQYKASARLFGQMQPAAEKTMANCRESAHAATMSEQHHVFARSYAELPA
jgi:hypothetical protein